jgi:hypothetical protein
MSNDDTAFHHGFPAGHEPTGLKLRAASQPSLVERGVSAAGPVTGSQGPKRKPMDFPITPNGFGTHKIGDLTLITNSRATKHADARASALRSEAAMRFIFVNGRTPRDDAYCALCSDTIRGSYVRELKTRRLYCDAQCFRGHIKSFWLVLQARARKAP